MPARFQDIKRVLLLAGIVAEPPRGGGSHWKLRDRDGKTYPIPCPNAERSEISDKYIRALCRTYGLDFEDFKSKL